MDWRLLSPVFSAVGFHQIRPGVEEDAPLVVLKWNRHTCSVEGRCYHTSNPDRQEWRLQPGPEPELLRPAGAPLPDEEADVVPLGDPDPVLAHTYW